MSSFSSACPHCGRVNPNAPQAILRDPPPPPRPIQARIAKPQPVTKPVDSEEEATPSPSSNLGILAGVFQWYGELAGEWRRLGRRQKTAAQILFSLAAITAAGFGFYAIFA